MRLLWLAAIVIAGCGGEIMTDGDGGDAGDMAHPGGGDGAMVHDLAMPLGDLAGFTMAPHPPWPILPKGGGHVLAPLKLVTIVAPGDPRAGMVATFSDQMVASQWWQAAGADYGLGAAGKTTHVTGAAMGNTMNQTDIDGYVSNAILGTVSPDGNTYFHLFIPDSVTVLDPNGSAVSFCGSHYAFGGGGDGIGWSRACSFLPSPTDSLTSTTSHETIEAATDTQGGYSLGSLGSSPWNDPIWLTLEAQGNVENGDLCEGTLVVEGGFTYQRSYSNAAAQAGGDPCAPAVAAPYVNVSAPKQWYQVTAGATVDVTLTGWSNAPTPDWALAPFVRTANNNGFQATIDGGTPVKIGLKTYPGVHNATTATLHVTAPNGGSATWASIIVISYPPAPSVDPYHFWLVGFYIP